MHSELYKLRTKHRIVDVLLLHYRLIGRLSVLNDMILKGTDEIG